MKFSLIFKFLIKNLMNFSQIIIICKIVMQWNVMEKNYYGAKATSNKWLWILEKALDNW